MKKLFATMLLAVFILSACGSPSPAPTAAPVVPTEVPPTIDSVSTEGINFVTFGDGSGNMLGTYVQPAVGQWVERNADNVDQFTFQEVKRDENSIYINDESRGIALQFDLQAQTIIYDSGTMYEIMKAEKVTEVPEAAKPVVDDNMWYRMRNQSVADMAVGIWNDGNNGIVLKKPGHYGDQYWRFIPQGNGTYKITNCFLENQNLFFDLFIEGENTRVYMAPLSDSQSQLWTVEALGNDTYRLTNVSLGDGYSLDINKENKLVLAENSISTGQVWLLEPLEAIQ